MRKLFGIFILFVSSVVFVFASQRECNEKEIYFITKKENQVELASVFCEYGKTKTVGSGENIENIQSKIVIYDAKNHIFKRISLQEAKIFLEDLRTYFTLLKRTSSARQDFIKAYILDPERFQNVAFQLLVELTFSSGEKKILKNARLLNIDRELYEKTYSQRLLMGGKIISREEWGADENIAKPEIFMQGCENGSCYGSGGGEISELQKNYLQNFNMIDAALKKEISYDDGRISHKYYPVDRIIIHHTASKYVPDKETGIKYMQSLQKYHGKTLRWSDIGYHYLIDGEGNIYEGRAGGKYVLGAHTTTHNYGSIGISLMSDGYYSPEMLFSLEKLTAYLGQEYGLNLTQTQNTKAQDMSGVTLGPVVLAHKELDSKKPVDPDIDMDNFRESIKNYFVLKEYFFDTNKKE